jgi:tetratricopeptide (TPR) repeat protein
MRRFMVCAAMCGILLTVAAGSATAQIGKSVSVAAGTPEDKALTDIYAATDGPDKIALLDKFMADYGKGDLELLGDQLYVQSYLAQKNYAKVYEYGDKALALDPDNFSTSVIMVHAAEEQGDTAKLFDAGQKVAAIVMRYKAAPAPEGTAAETWTAQRQVVLKTVEGDLGYVQYALLNAAYKTSNAAARAALLERYAATFPDSTYTVSAREQTAIAYQQAQNAPKMLAAAQNLLASNPDDISMLILLADTWCNDTVHLDKAAAYAQHALDLLAQAKKPDNVDDDQWQKQVALQKGLAYSSLGEVNVNKGGTRTAQAIDQFKQASPLLKSDTFSYAQNQYRLGFTLAKLQRIPEARVVLTEVVGLDSPYKSRALDTLNKIGGPVSSGKPSKKSS